MLSVSEIRQVVENDQPVDRVRGLLEKLQRKEASESMCAPDTEAVVTKVNDSVFMSTWSVSHHSK